jgi:hypothetical protein
VFFREEESGNTQKKGPVSSRCNTCRSGVTSSEMVMLRFGECHVGYALNTIMQAKFRSWEVDGFFLPVHKMANYFAQLLV